MRRYTNDFKIDAVKLADDIGSTKASKELNIPQGTLDNWVYKQRKSILEANISPNAKTSLSLAEENKRLQQEIRDLKRTNEILSKAAAFFAQSRKK